MESKLIHLTPTDLYCVEVTKDAYDFSNEKVSAQIDYLINVDYKGGYLAFEDSIILKDHYKDNWQILGVMKSESDLSFDPANYLESIIDNVNYFSFYTNYKSSGMKFVGTDASLDSLISLLASHNKYWKNPMQKSKCEVGCCCNEEQAHGCLGDYTLWKNFEDNLIKGRLLFLTKK